MDTAARRQAPCPTSLCRLLASYGDSAKKGGAKAKRRSRLLFGLQRPLKAGGPILRLAVGLPRGRQSSKASVSRSQRLSEAVRHFLRSTLTRPFPSLYLSPPRAQPVPPHPIANRRQPPTAISADERARI